MGTTVKQDNDFIKYVIPESFLEEAISWIAYNMNPEEVFSENDLEHWAINNGYNKE